MEDRKIKKESYNDKTQAERIKHLIFKQKTLMKTKFQTADFEEPVLFMARRSGEVTWHENATAGRFDFQHSDGSNRFIILAPSKQLKFGFADKMFKGYFCHEDFPLPLPEDPLMTTEQMSIMFEQAMSQVEKWKIKAKQQNIGMITAITVLVAVVIGGILLYIMLKPTQPPAQIIQQVVPTAQTIVSNFTG